LETVERLPDGLTILDESLQTEAADTGKDVCVRET